MERDEAVLFASSDCVGGLGFYGLCDLCDEMEMEVEAYTGMERDG